MDNGFPNLDKNSLSRYCPSLLIRSLSATGQGIGLLLPGQGALEEAERGNRLLWQTARLRTRLVRLEDGGEEERQALREAGTVPWTAAWT